MDDLPLPPDADARVVLLERAGCHLCDEARARVLAEARAAGCEVCRVDVDTDDALQAAWGEQVPVVILDGTVLARFRIEAGTLARALAPRTGFRRFLPGH